MTDLSGRDAPGGPNAAGGGMPSESDLPRLQGLDEDTHDPTDPTAAEQNPVAPPDSALDQLATPMDEESASDPMPDISGTSG